MSAFGRFQDLDSQNLIVIPTFMSNHQHCFENKRQCIHMHDNLATSVRFRKFRQRKIALSLTSINAGVR